MGYHRPNGERESASSRPARDGPHPRADRRQRAAPRRRPWPRACSASATIAPWPPAGPRGCGGSSSDTFDLVITDLVMNDVDGLAILAKAKETLPDAEVILVTGHGTRSLGRRRPCSRGRSTICSSRSTWPNCGPWSKRPSASLRLRRQNAELNRRLDEKFGFEGVIGTSPQMHDVIDRLKRIAPTDATRADPGGHRHGQGTGRPGHSSEQPAQEQAVRGPELRRA